MGAPDFFALGFESIFAGPFGGAFGALFPLPPGAAFTLAKRGRSATESGCFEDFFDGGTLDSTGARR
jgi:hypothetical protein